MKNDSMPALYKLLPIQSNEDVGQAVNARGLHAALKVKRDFSTWIKSRLEECLALEGNDYCVVHGSPDLGSAKNRIDYALTLDTAKHIAMLERNEMGRLVRQYFLECERRAAPAALPTDHLTLALHASLENRKDLAALAGRVTDVEIAIANAPIDSAQVGIIYRLGQQLGQVMGSYPRAWRLFKDHYQIASYRDLQSSKFDVARRFLEIQISAYTGQNALVSQ